MDRRSGQREHDIALVPVTAVVGGRATAGVGRGGWRQLVVAIGGRSSGERHWGYILTIRDMSI